MKRIFLLFMVFVSIVLLPSCSSLLQLLGIESAQPEPAPAVGDYITEEARSLLFSQIEYEKIPLDELTSRISSVTTEAHGFIVDAYITHPDWYYIWIGNQPARDDGFNYQPQFKDPILNLGSPFMRQSYPDFEDRYEVDREYTLFIAMVKIDKYGRISEGLQPILVKIEGLRTPDEVAAKKIADQKAIDEANKYDVSKFTVVSSDFKPLNYQKADLFDAEVIIKNSIILISKKFVSDVIFELQQGTAIRFRTEDDAISKVMDIDSRSNLVPGQKVKVYYEVFTWNYSLIWHVDAIELL